MAAPALDPSTEPAVEPSAGPGRRGLRRLLARPTSARGRSAVAWLCARVLGSAGAGALLYLSFPPRTSWWLVLPAFALLGAVLWGRAGRAGFGYGFLFG
ncbi:MAG TPA: apolipoprotein N-acyltransferase, partial [Pseudonocardia sp.]|nr:apolipoprotein N-acyltransferase [Pseudonocardia sp.]